MTHPTPIPHDEIATIREAAKPFVDFARGMASWMHDGVQITQGSSMARAQLNAGHFRALASALASLESALATAASAHRAGQEQMREGAAEYWRDLCEKDDRTSPAEHPDMALITFDEFREIFARSVSPSTTEAMREAAAKCAIKQAHVIGALPFSSIHTACHNIYKEIMSLPLTVEAPGAKPLDYARRVLDDPVASSGATLPCDVIVMPATILRKGVNLTTLTTALRARDGKDVGSVEDSRWRRGDVSEPPADNTALREEIARLGRLYDDLVAEKEKSRLACTKAENLVAQLSDKYNGEPCAEIRWQMEREDFKTEADILRAQVAELTAQRDEEKQSNDIRGEIIYARTAALAESAKALDEARAELAQAYRGLGYADDDNSATVDAGKGEPAP